MSEENDQMRLRHRAALLTQTQPSFLGSVLARYRDIEEIDAAALAQRLHVDLATLDGLAICRVPRPDRFADDTNVIASRFGANVGALAAVLRHVAAIDALAESASDSWLQAAREDNRVDRRLGSDRD